ncbi:MAG: NAD(P)/FAD-dependent oxidoreductase, partial [Gammaproteobacteria bacterium]|nr:NAD(P)/FAD-dependent oxidoreductase [Gammaproteobacteria bacterium]
MATKTAIIIGAGPAGLTAAYELLTKTDIKPIIFEADDIVGGISKTLNYKGNRIDLGGHRFFSKSQLVTNWWLQFLPLQQSHNEQDDNVMLSRNRLSRIYFLGKFFDYPISLSWHTLKNLGLVRVCRVIVGYILAKIFPVTPERNLEDFFINRFGKELYSTFFKDYTKKVWGIGCKDISADWGAQRARKLSIYKTLLHAVKKKLGFRNFNSETSLTESFFYPKLGPGQFWEAVASRVLELGGELYKNCEVVSLENIEDKITTVSVRQNGELKTVMADYVFSSMPIKDLLLGFSNQVPADVFQVGTNLQYRDFITVGLLIKKLPIEFLDNWIYIQDRDVKMGRVQIFNNWSPYLVKDSNTIWLGLEYFCFEGDGFWSLPDEKIISLATRELKKIFLIDEAEVLDGVVIRVPKAYPVYFGAYNNFNIAREYLDKYSNLFLIGRNGMHRYNN